MKVWNHEARKTSIVALELKNDKSRSQHQAQGQMINSNVGICKKNQNTDFNNSCKKSWLVRRRKRGENGMVFVVFKGKDITYAASKGRAKEDIPEISGLVSIVS